MNYNRLKRFFQPEQPKAAPTPETTRPGFVAVSMTGLPQDMRTAMQDNRSLYEWAYRNAQQAASPSWDDEVGGEDYSI